MTPSVTELTNNSSLPPALPPKRSRSIKSNATPPPISPKPTISMQSIHTIEPIVTSTPVKIEESGCIHDKKELTPSTPVKLVNILKIHKLLILDLYYQILLIKYHFIFRITLP